MNNEKIKCSWFEWPYEWGRILEVGISECGSDNNNMLVMYTNLIDVVLLKKSHFAFKK